MLEHRTGHAWRELLRAQPVTPTDDAGRSRQRRPSLRQRPEHRQVKGFAQRAWLFGAIQNRHRLGRLGQCGQEGRQIERLKQPDRHNADSFAPISQPVCRGRKRFDA